MQNCCNCTKNFLEETEYVCSECREPLCSSCWSNGGGLCDYCYSKYYDEDEEDEE